MEGGRRPGAVAAGVLCAAHPVAAFAGAAAMTALATVAALVTRPLLGAATA